MQRWEDGLAVVGRVHCPLEAFEWAMRLARQLYLLSGLVLSKYPEVLALKGDVLPPEAVPAVVARVGQNLAASKPVYART